MHKISIMKTDDNEDIFDLMPFFALAHHIYKNKLDYVMKNPNNLGSEVAYRITSSVPSGKKYLDIRDSCLTAFSSVPRLPPPTAAVSVGWSAITPAVPTP